MNFRKIKVKSRLSAIIISTLIGFTIISVGIIVMLLRLENYKDDEIMDTTYKYINAHTEVENFISKYENLVKGISAYIQTFDNYSDEKMYSLFDNLLNKDLDVIRNIGVAKDTTLIWLYPLEGNEKAIGVDLSKIEEQADAVLEAKNNLKTVFHGPINLVQGGTGFIIRIPILKNDKYWGMTSIVLRGETTFNFIENQEKAYKMEYLITTKDDTSDILYGNPDILNKNPLLFKNDFSLGSWDIYAIPSGGWKFRIKNFIVMPLIILSSIAFLFSNKVFKTLLDYSNIKDKHRALQTSSTTDGLTKIYNRKYFDNRVIEEIANADRYNHNLSLIYFDLDNFKHVNDTFGHSEGDYVLLTVADVVSNIIRAGDVFARWGGDEFVLLMPDTSIRGALTVAEKIRSSIEELEFELPIKLTSSLGVSQHIENEFWNSWFRRTDAALYKSKQDGKNRLTISEDMVHKKILIKITWKDSWSSGNKVIDEEHKNLFKLSNELIEMSFSAKNKSAYIQKIEELFEHTISHFESEEKILKELKYANLEDHINSHNELISQFKDLMHKAKSDLLTPDDLFEFLFVNVIVNHLISEDSKYFSYTNKNS